VAGRIAGMMIQNNKKRRKRRSTNDVMRNGFPNRSVR
jgi:hypothetical protein